MIEKTIKCQLVAKQNGIYEKYVFKDLDKENEYIMCTRLPNWDLPELQLYDSFFITVQEVESGEPYYNRKEDKMSKFLYSGIYLMNCIIYNNNNHLGKLTL